MNLSGYIENLNNRYNLGNTTEHSFRSDLQQLLETLIPDIKATNEPKRQACGAPDYILTRQDIPIGFIETKNIGDKDLEGNKKTGNKEQFDRYKSSLNNIIFTDYLSFYFYRNQQFITKVTIGEVQNNKISALKNNFINFENLIKDFCTNTGQTIKSPQELAKMMAGKARILAEVIEKSLIHDETNNQNSTLKDQIDAFKQILIHDIKPKEFSDVYAQTIVYGMFAARLNDQNLETFSRQKAAELIPKSNPFLRKLFSYIAGIDLDDRIKWVLDDLVNIFLACDIKQMLANYGKQTLTEDPIIHFYEDFLSEYDSALRKARGVWYTPKPIVNFMVRAVDDILKAEFDLPQGLADNTKIQETHKVQILDPATGTGTFLAEIIKHIYKNFERQQGIWSNYVENHLLPRLNGFELLMASYAMAHLKLDLLLTETGYNSSSFSREQKQRFRIYLTNSLEEAKPLFNNIYLRWLSDEANEASKIKKDIPVMCIIGNPPYSGVSSNNNDWIESLMTDYKKEPGGTEKLNERKHWLNDDYVKFLRYGQYFIEKNNNGILAFINPHGFLDNPTFRGMRWNLLKTYDKIYTIDLHGNSKKKETSPDGSIDQNVFDIMQGVSINIFIKTGKKKPDELGKVFHYDLFGKRAEKFKFLNENSLKTVKYQELPNIAPNYFFVPKNNKGQAKYEKGFSLEKLFLENVTGIVTMGDEFAFSETKNELVQRLNEFKNKNITENELKNKYNLGKNYAEFILKNKEQLKIEEEKFIKCSYRPFDDRYTYFDNKILWRWRFNVMQHFLLGENVGLTFCKQFKTGDSYVHFFITNKIIESSYVSNRTSEITSIAPLYLYSKDLFEKDQERIPNLNLEIIKHIEKKLSLSFVNEKQKTKNTFAPIDILDYIYAILHSPNYREKYKEFLKIDFPRVPYPENQQIFWQLVKFGNKLRELHLLESQILDNYITEYPIDGNNKVEKIKFEKSGEVGKVYINENQYFNDVPEIAWNFYIGGYQPAQKWLKDRKDKTLEFNDILHYQKIIVALIETDRLMKEIELIT